MSEYVEARYALLKLEEAREAGEARASNLLNGLLDDLSPAQGDGSQRADTLASIRHLMLILREHKTPPPSYWDAAHRAANAWRDRAYH